jgi:mRNA-degrading endonuclease HigB of HigAB toxin-antitoxin module
MAPCKEMPSNLPWAPPGSYNIAGNKYRVVVWINYPYRVVYVRFIGTHKQYDRIDAQAV